MGVRTFPGEWCARGVGVVVLATSACTPFLKASGDTTFDNAGGSDSGPKDRGFDSGPKNRAVMPPERGKCRERLGPEAKNGESLSPPPDGGFESAVIPDDSLLAFAKVHPPQFMAGFGYRVAATTNAVAATAPFQGFGATRITCEGAVYLFEGGGLEHPIPLFAPNASEDDGSVSGTDGPDDVQKYPRGWGASVVAIDEDIVVLGVAGEDSGTTDPDDESAEDSGAVYIWDRHDIGAKPLYLKAPVIHAGAWFGASVALSSTHLIVGAGRDPSGTRSPSDTSAKAAGAVYDYERIGNDYVLKTTIKSPYIHAGDQFGASVAIDGDLLVVGAPTDDSSAINGPYTAPVDPLIFNNQGMPTLGAAYVFRRVGEAWVFQSYLKPNVASVSTLFGFSVGVSGGHVAIGAPGAHLCSLTDPTNVSERGAVHVFSERDGQWKRDGCLSPRGQGGLFGWSVKMLGDRLAVGSPWDAHGRAGSNRNLGAFSGAAYVFQGQADGTFNEPRYVKPPNATIGDVFGFTVALAPGRLVVGAPQQSSTEATLEAVPQRGGFQSGAVYLFSTDAPQSAQ